MPWLPKVRLSTTAVTSCDHVTVDVRCLPSAGYKASAGAGELLYLCLFPSVFLIPPPGLL